jgi:hypothetical protein
MDIKTTASAKKPESKLNFTEERKVFAVYTNTDLTEGRGREYLLALTENLFTAKRLAKGKDVQGTDARVVEKKMYFVPNHPVHRNMGEWYAPASFVHLPTEEDIKAEKEHSNKTAKNILLEKFKKGESITETERSAILAMIS